MNTLVERIRAQLERPYYRLSHETSGVAKVGINVIRRQLTLHGDDGDGWCDHCGYMLPCPTIRVIAEAMDIKDSE